MWTDADSPWCFLAACFEWHGYVNDPERWISRIPIGQDGTCSGLQHYSAMLRDPIGGAAVNLIPAEEPQDIYAVVAEKTIAKLNTLPEADPSYPLAQEWLKSGLVNRKLTKRSVMTLPYGSTNFSAHRFVRDYIEEVREKDPFKVPWEGREAHDACVFVAEVVWGCIKETVVSAAEAMQWLKKLGRYIVRHNCPIAWTTPTGMVVMQRYMDFTLRKVYTHLFGSAYKAYVGEEGGGKGKGRYTKSISADTKKSVKVQLYFPEQMDTLNVRKNISAFAPNFVHSLDASALVKAVNMAHRKEGIKQFALIHDSFGTLAADSETLARVLREEFVKMYEENDVLQQLYEEVLGYVKDAQDMPPPPPAKGTLNLREVLDSPYFFA
jgi:DNA-directed RNA polymerase